MAPKLIVAQNIKSFRIQKGLTAIKLAAKIGRTPAFISMLERAKRMPSFQTISLIAEALDVPIHLLYDSSNARNGTNVQLKLFRMQSDFSDGSTAEGLLSIACRLSLAGIGVLDPSKHIALILEDDSMSPTFRNQSIVVIDLSPKRVTSNDFVVCKIKRFRQHWEERMLRQVVLDSAASSRVVLKAVNNAYPELTVRIRAEAYDEVKLDALSIDGKVVMNMSCWE